MVALKSHVCLSFLLVLRKHFVSLTFPMDFVLCLHVTTFLHESELFALRNRMKLKPGDRYGNKQVSHKHEEEFILSVFRETPAGRVCKLHLQFKTCEDFSV